LVPHGGDRILFPKGLGDDLGGAVNALIPRLSVGQALRLSNVMKNCADSEGVKLIQRSGPPSS